MKSLLFHVEDDIHKHLKQLAVDKGESMSALLRSLLDGWLKKQPAIKGMVRREQQQQQQ